ncbi:hypothetical protein Hbal_2738 [Hirschia baltica ATCC 49814]|uniref:Uncharacterized protein n=1 Tax=Hirschia baltica (strain ATCC 49814 / DSM 5838 / IFAM 1418) TaxID=582402 RepID=C6XQB2_HIRBI|nr:hypothetical protein Hbal_2738 [Hirschia baltica ATCC 49814]
MKVTMVLVPHAPESNRYALGQFSMRRIQECFGNVPNWRESEVC